MIIKIKSKSSEDGTPSVTIDTSNCIYLHTVRNALKLALELDGFDKNAINDILGLQEDVKVAPEESKYKTASQIACEVLKEKELNEQIRIQREESIRKSVKGYLDIIGPVIAAKVASPEEARYRTTDEIVCTELKEEQKPISETTKRFLDIVDSLPIVGGTFLQKEEQIKKLKEFRDYMLNRHASMSIQGVVDYYQKEIIEEKNFWVDFETVLHMKYPRNQKFKRQRLSEFVENTEYQDLTKEFKDMINAASISKNADDLRIDKNGVMS